MTIPDVPPRTELSNESSHSLLPNVSPAKSGKPGRGQIAKRRNTKVSGDDIPASQAIRKEKNRRAASRCRGKKRLEENVMEEKRKSLQLHNNILQDIAIHLREEVLFLKNQILKHGACDFPPIQDYIVASASSIYGPTPEK